MTAGILPAALFIPTRLDVGIEPYGFVGVHSFHCCSTKFVLALTAALSRRRFLSERQIFRLPFHIFLYIFLLCFRSRDTSRRESRGVLRRCAKIIGK